MNKFNRTKKSEIENYISSSHEPKQVLVVSGARQVGKTTLINECLQNKESVSFNLEEARSIAQQIDACRDFADFEIYLKTRHAFDPSKHILFIDEAQHSEKLGSFVRFMKERWQTASVILSGSLMAELHRHTERRPVGAEQFLDLWPMTFKEFLMARQQNDLVEKLVLYHWGDSFLPLVHEMFVDEFEKYLKVGGLPNVVSHFLAGIDYQKAREDILQSYEDDFIRYFSIDNVNLFRRCLLAVASNAGSPSKDSQAIRPESSAYKKVPEIYAKLEKWKLIIKVDQVGLEPEANKYYPKRYLHDVGVLRDLRLRATEDVGLKDLSVQKLRTPLGGIIENALVLSLKTQFNDALFGIKLDHQTEIDLAVKAHGKVWPIECKMSNRFKTSFTQATEIYLEKMTRKGTGILFYGGPPLAKKQRNVLVLPYYLSDELGRLLTNL